MAQAERYGLELLRPRERRQPRMPNATNPLVEQRVSSVPASGVTEVDVEDHRAILMKV